MINVQEYLQNHSLDDLKRDFTVSHRRHERYPNLVSLSYSLISSPLDNPIVQECRGIILDEANNWKIVAFPFKKFFNLGEKNAAKINWNDSTAYLKNDGSLAILYWYDDQWQVATSGSPDAGGNTVGDKELTYRRMFWETFTKLKMHLPEHKSICYMFELMGPVNRVVVNYYENELRFIGARCLQTNEELPITDSRFPRGWLRAQPYYIINGEQGVKDFVEDNLNKLGLEGLVVVDNDWNRVKIKCKRYVELHHLKEQWNPRSILDLVRKGEQDEMIAYFPEFKDSIEVVMDKYQRLILNVNCEYEMFKHIVDRKEFASAVKNNKYSSFLFALKSGKDLHEVLKTIPIKSVEQFI